MLRINKIVNSRSFNDLGKQFGGSYYFQDRQFVKIYLFQPQEEDSIQTINEMRIRSRKISNGWMILFFLASMLKIIYQIKSFYLLSKQLGRPDRKLNNSDKFQIVSAIQLMNQISMKSLKIQLRFIKYTKSLRRKKNYQVSKFEN